MRVPNGTTVLVADGSKMLLLENRGEAFSPRLEVVKQHAQDIPPDRELSTDRAGRSHSSMGRRSSALQETDFHEQAEDRFAGEVAAHLNERGRSANGNGIIVIAPPRTLGKLRQHYQGDVECRLIAEISKDLTGHPVQDIARLITEYVA